MPARKVLLMGLPGAGKTTLAQALAPLIGAVHVNADDVRANVHGDLGFAPEDRIEHARRIGWWCDRITAAGSYAIADFVCPTVEARAAFGAANAYVVWLDRIAAGRFEDTNRLFEPPEHYDIRVGAAGAPEYWATIIAGKVKPHFDPKAPTALFVGRYQPFHDGHRRLIAEGIERVGQACIAVRDTGGIDEKNPYEFAQVKHRIEQMMADYAGRYTIVALPNITTVLYGRDVGYSIERVDLPEDVQAVSATDLRRRMMES